MGIFLLPSWGSRGSVRRPRRGTTGVTSSRQRRDRPVTGMVASQTVVVPVVRMRRRIVAAGGTGSRMRRRLVSTGRPGLRVRRWVAAAGRTGPRMRRGVVATGRTRAATWRAGVPTGVALKGLRGPVPSTRRPGILPSVTGRLVVPAITLGTVKSSVSWTMIGAVCCSATWATTLVGAAAAKLFGMANSLLVDGIGICVLGAQGHIMLTLSSADFADVFCVGQDIIAWVHVGRAVGDGMALGMLVSVCMCLGRCESKHTLSATTVANILARDLDPFDLFLRGRAGGMLGHGCSMGIGRSAAMDHGVGSCEEGE